MGCAKGTLKYLLYFFNLVICLCGLALLIVGILYQLDISAISEKFEDTLSISAIFVIVVGSIIFVISFLGCCGAIKENKCFLLLYAIILIAFLVFQVAIGIYALVEIDDSGDFNRTIEDTLEKAFKEDDDFRNDMQKTFECCGVNGPPLLNPDDSCCPEDAARCTIANAYKVGCTQKMVEFFMDSAKVLGIVAICLAGIELIPGIFALCLRGMI